MAKCSCLRKLVSGGVGSSSPIRRGYGCAAQLLLNYDGWEPPPPLEDINAHRIERSPRWSVIGSPGLDKRAYASRLAALLQVPHISMADLLRKEMARPTFIAKQILFAVNQGMLVPDDVIVSLFSRRLEEEDADSGFLLEGFPRTPNQAVILDEAVGIDLVLSLRANDDVLEMMCMRRRICSECGRDFHVAKVDAETCSCSVSSLPPPQSCSFKMRMRADDTQAALKKKLRIYSDQIKLVEEYYRKQGKLLDFEVSGGISQCWPHLLAALQLGGDQRINCTGLTASA